MRNEYVEQLRNEHIEQLIKIRDLLSDERRSWYSNIYEYYIDGDGFYYCLGPKNAEDNITRWIRDTAEICRSLGEEHTMFYVVGVDTTPNGGLWVPSQNEITKCNSVFSFD